MANFSEEAKIVLKERYLRKDMSTGEVCESEDDMLVRVAEHVSIAEEDKDREQWRDKFYEIMDSLQFLPNSPTLMNAGKDDGQLSACFVLPVEDNMESIMNCVKNCALIHKTGGGTGLSLSRIRPEGSMVGSTIGVASGPVSFLKIFDVTTDVIKQGGVRRGANLANLNIAHPDIEKFIEAKLNNTLQNFNLSVVVTDDFMRKSQTNQKHRLMWHGDILGEVKAKDLFNKIAACAWSCGDPGLQFIDIANRFNPTPYLGRYEGTNPCGEQFLLPHQSCNLGSIDVSKFVKNKKIDFDRLEPVVRTAIRFLDDVIDVNCFPNIKIRNKTMLTRNIGLGIMGWADLLIELDVEYGSRESYDVADSLMGFIQVVSQDESEKLGKLKGSYPAIREKRKKRNAALTCIAPTGTLSILAGCSSGIEPLFSKNFTKTVLNGYRIDYGKKYEGKKFLTALELPYNVHIEMQSAFQKHVDNSISKTINMPNSATVEDVEKAFYQAWQMGCKGITIFRDGSKRGVLETTELSECQDGRCKI